MFCVHDARTPVIVEPVLVEIITGIPRGGAMGRAARGDRPPSQTAETDAKKNFLHSVLKKHRLFQDAKPNNPDWLMNLPPGATVWIRPWIIQL
jgi:hypothetical protein